jgi:hypothetical protein
MWPIAKTTRRLAALAGGQRGLARWSYSLVERGVKWSESICYLRCWLFSAASTKPMAKTMMTKVSIKMLRRNADRSNEPAV